MLPPTYYAHRFNFQHDIGESENQNSVFSVKGQLLVTFTIFYKHSVPVNVS